VQVLEEFPADALAFPKKHPTWTALAIQAKFNGAQFPARELEPEYNPWTRLCRRLGDRVYVTSVDP